MRAFRNINALKLNRNTVLFVFGLAGTSYEVFIDKIERPTLLILLGAMMGLPAFLKKDEDLHKADVKKEAPGG